MPPGQRYEWYREACMMASVALAGQPRPGSEERQLLQDSRTPVRSNTHLLVRSSHCPQLGDVVSDLLVLKLAVGQVITQQLSFISTQAQELYGGEDNLIMNFSEVPGTIKYIGEPTWTGTWKM